MDKQIRELRKSTGLTQKDFARIYDIPLSTLRKWEQGESSPAPYVIRLLARMIPATDERLITINGRNGEIYYYDKATKTVSDSLNNVITIQEDLDQVNPRNLGLYLQELYDDFHDIQERFNRDCRYDIKEGIIWS